MEGVTADRIILDEAQQVLADMVAKDYERKAGMVRLEADEKYTTLGLIQAKCIKELEFELVKVRELTALLLEYRVETLGTDAKRAVDALPGDLTDLDKLVWLGENEYLFRALAFSRPKT